MPQQNSALPIKRFRAVILGGGIHGVGIAHDLASRGWRDVLLAEKGTVGSGTSSRSTKLIHGGLRYLEHIRDFHLVSEGLKERRLLMELAPDLVKPLGLIFPVLKKGGMPRLMIKAGLTLYDLLAGSSGIGRHRSLSSEETALSASFLDQALFKHFYMFYDGQTDDLGLVQRVAKSAVILGVNIQEHSEITQVRPVLDGYEIQMQTPLGPETVSARYVINAAGPWAHHVLRKSGIAPKYEGINNKGAHLILDDMGLKHGVFLQSPEDRRIFFVLPWENKTLVGTTESDFDDDPDNLSTVDADVTYLLNHFNRYSRRQISEKDVLATFSGLRWLARDRAASLSDTSRSHVISEHESGTGMLYTIYGGKLTAYRALSQEVGDMVFRHYGEEMPSRTADRSFWAKSGAWGVVPPVSERFQSYEPHV